MLSGVIAFDGFILFFVDEATAHISTRQLALVRFKRNHELMNEVFNNAAKRASSESSLCPTRPSFL